MSASDGGPTAELTRPCAKERWSRGRVQPQRYFVTALSCKGKDK